MTKLDEKAFSYAKERSEGVVAVTENYFLGELKLAYIKGYNEGLKDDEESTLRKVIKYFSNCILDENCGGYFSHLLDNEEELQELAKELA